MNNRSFKSFPREAIEFLKLHRHDNLDIFIYSQAEDYDVTVRRLCERMYILRKSRIRCFSSLQLVYPSWVSDQISGQVRVQWCLAPFPSGIQWFYRPRYYKYFDSWARPPLPPLPAEQAFQKQLEKSGSEISTVPKGQKTISDFLLSHEIMIFPGIPLEVTALAL